MQVYTDAARDNGIAAMGWEIIHDSGDITDGNRYVYGEYTSMQAEYFALLDGIRHAMHYKPEAIWVVTDCEPLVKKMHYTREFDDPWNRRRKLCQRLLRNFDEWDISWAPRANNTNADRLAYEALETARQA